MTRWTVALGASLLVHTGAAVGTLGWQKIPSVEVTPGEAQVAVVFRSKPVPRRPALSLEPLLEEKKLAQPLAAIPEVEGAESSLPQSLHNPPPPYPLEAFRPGIQGVTSLFVQVSPQGLASSVGIECSSGSVILDEAAAGAVTRWTFIPARRMGVPVAGSIRIRMRFQIIEEEKLL